MDSYSEYLKKHKSIFLINKLNKLSGLSQSYYQAFTSDNEDNFPYAAIENTTFEKRLLHHIKKNIFTIFQ